MTIMAVMGSFMTCHVVTMWRNCMNSMISIGSAYFVCSIELEISAIQLEISPNRQYLQISPIQLEISPNRHIWRYLQLNLRYLQFNWRDVHFNWRYLQFSE